MAAHVSSFVVSRTGVLRCTASYRVVLRSSGICVHGQLRARRALKEAEPQRRRTEDDTYKNRNPWSFLVINALFFCLPRVVRRGKWFAPQTRLHGATCVHPLPIQHVESRAKPAAKQSRSRKQPWDHNQVVPKESPGSPAGSVRERSGNTRRGGRYTRFSGEEKGCKYLSCTRAAPKSVSKGSNSRRLAEEESKPVSLCLCLSMGVPGRPPLRPVAFEFVTERSNCEEVGGGGGKHRKSVLRGSTTGTGLPPKEKKPLRSRRARGPPRWMNTYLTCDVWDGGDTVPFRCLRPYDAVRRCSLPPCWGRPDRA